MSAGMIMTSRTAASGCGCGCDGAGAPSLSVAEAVQQISTRCQAEGKRLTSNRRQVLEVLAAEQRAMSAYEIIDALKSGQPGIQPPTVYRALAFLVEQGCVHLVASKSRYLLCNHLQHPHQAQILICDECGAIQELAMRDEVFEPLQRSAQAQGFLLTRHSFELHGLCRQCQAARSS